MNMRSPAKSQSILPRVALAYAMELLTPIVTAPALAQADTTGNGSKSSGGSDPQWKAFFYAAKQAYAEKRWAEAKSLLLKASAIKVTPQVLGNLAQAEIQLGEYRAAATHAAEAMATPGKSAGSAQDWAVASKHVGKLIIAANVEGAKVRIDGEDVGLVAPGKAFFVDPGMRKIEVTKDGYLPAEKDIVAQKAAEQRVAFELLPEPETKTVLPAAVAPPSKTEPNPPLAKPFEEPRREPGKPSPVVLIAGGLVAVGGLVTGFVFNSKANSSGDKAQALSDEFGPSGCSSNGTVSEAKCDSLLDERRDHDRFRNISTVSFAIGGTALVATAVYWFWPRPARPSTASKLRVVGSTGASGSWFGVSGSF